MSSTPPPQSRLRKRVLVLIAALGMVAYLAGAFVTDYDALRGAMRNLGWSGAALVLGLSLLNYVLRFVRWHWYLHDLGHALPWARHLTIYLGGFLFTVSPAKAGEAVRGLYLKEHGVPYADTFAALFVERLLDFLAYALLAILIVVRYPDYRPFLGLAFALAAVLLILAGRPGLPRWIEGLAARRGPRVATPLRALAQLLQSSRRMLRASLLVPGLAIGLVSWGAEGIGFHLICEGLTLDVPPMSATSIYAIAGLAGAATFFMPGGIGGMEAVMTALLTALGAPLPLAIVATLLCRLATLWFAVFLGFFAIAALEMRMFRPIARPST
nr:lysylphosphatidylglycerol synthase transmembrane domain-containing protein [Panacagrimonas sp.]